MTSQLIKTSTETFQIDDEDGLISIYVVWIGAGKHLCGIVNSWSQAFDLLAKRERLNKECGF